MIDLFAAGLFEPMMPSSSVVLWLLMGAVDDKHTGNGGGVDLFSVGIHLEDIAHWQSSGDTSPVIKGGATRKGSNT